MSIALSPILELFAERTPFPVMVRGLLERCLNPRQLDAWFERVADVQYTRTLLFSSLFDLMTNVVLRQQPSVHAAYRAGEHDIGVSLTSVYNKLNGLEPPTSAALVNYAAQQAGALIEELNAAHAPLLKGGDVRMLDGNCLGGREHRLQETRSSAAAPLPGKVLAVFDPALGVVSAIYPSEDAYTQERALLPPVLADVQAGQLWIADRNFCTAGFLSGLVAQGAWPLIREHEGLRFTPLEPMRVIGRTDTGEVSEQWVRLGTKKEAADALRLRRIQIKLDKPTRDGEDTIYLFCTLPVEMADAITLAQLYRTRWRIEQAFLHLTMELRCEVDTLSHPPAAIFALACAMTVYNVLAVAKAALRSVHGDEAVEAVSGYYLAIEIGNVAESLERVIDAEDWTVFHTLSITTLAVWLCEQAQRVDLRRYRKSTRGAKKSTPKRTYDPAHPHASVARLLARRKMKSGGRKSP